MADHRYADRAARVLRTARERLGERPAEDAFVAIGRLKGAVVAVARRRQRWRILLMTGACAAAGVAVALLLPLVVPTPGSGTPIAAEVEGNRAALTIESGGAGRLIDNVGIRAAVTGSSLAAGESIETDGAPLALDAQDGTRVVVAPHSEVTLAQAGAIRWFRLSAGGLDMKVAKLSLGERFVIATPDREVEVHGTRFQVRLAPRAACGGGTVTRVAVDEGVVTVRARQPGALADRAPEQETIRAGGRWPADCRQQATSRDVAAAAPRDVAAAPPRDVGAPPLRRAGPRHPLRAAALPEPPGDDAVSTLAAENDLFAAAIRAERRDDPGAALRALDLLVSRYPASPLREAAVAERLKIDQRLRGEGGVDPAKTVSPTP